MRYVLTLLLATCCMVAGGVARADAASPQIRLSISSQPTNFQAGTSAAPGGQAALPTYAVIATNIGTAATDGPLEIVAQLPPSLTVLEPVGEDFSGEIYPCGVSGQTVTCTLPKPLRPSQSFTIALPVAVASTAPSSVTTEVAISGGGAPVASSSVTTAITDSPASFGFLDAGAGLNGVVTSPDGTVPAILQAGSHPAQLTVELGLNTKGVRNLLLETNIVAGGLAGSGALRDAEVQLPPGFVVDPSATSVECTEAELMKEGTGGKIGCPDASQVGMVSVLTSIASVKGQISPLYKMVAPPGAAASFGFNAIGLNIPIHLLGGVNAAGDYELSALASDILARPFNPILAMRAEFWGDPSSPVHEALRGSCLFVGSPCPLPPRTNALVAAPTSCSANLPLAARVASWEAPNQFVSRTGLIEDLDGTPVSVAGCQQLDFSPRITLEPEVHTADSPTGLHVRLHIPQDNSLNTLAEAHLKDATVTLPEGVAVSPSAANGLGACAPDQVNLHDGGSARCPDDSKIGTVEVSTPLLDHSLPGAIYVMKPYDNPFGSLLGIYVVVDDPRSGVVIKLAGRVDADPDTGQLTARFSDNPQLPFEDFDLDFYGGPRAALKTPSVCGSPRSQSTLVPWSGSAAVTESSAFAIDRGPAPGGCASTEGQQPFSPSFEAGTVGMLAGDYSPFVLHLRREDGSQLLRGLEVKLPEGLLGRLQGIPYCPPAALAAAAGATGSAERAAPSCPSASRVGSVTVGAGPGSSPFYVNGSVYLAGPYKGAPLSLAIVTPAVAGPFDLGTVVVRAALNVDPFTAQVSAVSDPIPTILQGIPLDIRSVDVHLDRQQFTLNPTSCDPSAVTAAAISLTGGSAPLQSRFQVGGCRALDFKPKLKLSLHGATRRTGHPALKAVLTFPKNGTSANIARAQVGLPHSEFLDQGNLNKVCTQSELKAAACPKSAIYGRAKAWSPLLDRPLEGPVYLAVGFGYQLPALVADLNGQIRILLKGKVDTTKQQGLRSTFEAVPDAPVSRFVLEMKGGKKYGLLENSENICRQTQRASVQFDAQNGASKHMTPKIMNSCKRAKR